MKALFLTCLCSCLLHISYAQDLGQAYVEAWKKFYPSKALNQGMHDAIFAYEDYSLDNINNWISYNKSLLRLLQEPKHSYREARPINARLLRVQAQTELDKWTQSTPHLNSLSLYARAISNAIPPLLEADYLTPSEQTQLICQRLNSVLLLTTQAEANIKSGSKSDLESGLRALERAANFFIQELPEVMKSWPQDRYCPEMNTLLQQARKSLKSLTSKTQKQWLPKALETSPILGRDEYARQLALYTDSDLTPEKLAQIALQEIQTTKGIMLEVARSYLQQTYPTQALPASDNEVIKRALADMEKDAPLNASDYLAFWQGLTQKAIAFIKEKDLATLPKYETLRIQTAPESAGAAARIGWVSSAPPFDPNPVTTLYLPSIPETLPQQEQIDFWASFNKPFNRMIVIHELYPGHYMQIKVSRENPHPLRLLFPYGIYTEGWATFTEKVLLDAGWEKENPLTLLAHLRKRLENANRAYTSVQVHSQNWSQEKVLEFSITESLLAPQFAKSLWGRIMRSPMQLTSYFLGGQQFTKLLAAEKERLGADFELKRFMDTVMQAGPIPIDEFYRIFAEGFPK